MTLLEIEQQLHQLLAQLASRGVPFANIPDMISMCDAGEPAIALEILCSQLDDHEVPVPGAVVDKLRELGTAMRLKPSYWERLRVSDGSEI